MISKEELKWVAGFALLVMLITSLPYLIAFQTQGDQWRFTGFLFGVEDGNSYIAKMLSGTHGAWLFRTPYTGMDQRGVLAFFPYLLLGKLAGGEDVHTQLLVLFHLFRVGAIWVLIASVYRFASLFLSKIGDRRLAVALIVFGGGLGFLHPLGLEELWNSQLPLEYYSPETFGFLAVYGLPHLILARAFLLLGLRSYLVDEVGRGFVTKQALLWGGIGLLQPLTILSGWAVMGGYFLFLFIRDRVDHRKPSRCDVIKRVQRLAIGGLAGLPFVLYNFLMFQFDPYLRVWNLQNLILSPPVTHYLLGWGLLLPASIFGLIRYINKWPGWGLLAAWIPMGFLLAYVPYPLQRRLPEGVWVAIVIAGVAGLGEPLRGRKAIRMLLAAFSFLPAILLISGGIMSVLHPTRPVFRPSDEVMTFRWLADNAKKGEKVLADYETSNGLPAWAPVRVVIGHGPESANLKVILPEVEKFFQPEEQMDRSAFLIEHNIDYILTNKDEQRELDPNLLSNEVFSRDGYVIYRVRW